ncbi:MAG: pyridoxal-phosphate dependent enzyme [Chitinophagaceae bacterium]|nr:pyridoxal-phosphate dependent enzyme [Chitinophagaceae bacterium]
MIELANANLEPLVCKRLREKECTADVLRLDKLHPVVSGNKWFKLKYYLQDAIDSSKNTILTYGGAWSNHIIAAAYAARAYGMQSVGIIRGEAPALLSPTLKLASAYGMELVFSPRNSYRSNDAALLEQQIVPERQDAYIIPEGGEGMHGRRGCGEILSLVPEGYHTHILCAIGTGTMFTGILNASSGKQQVIGIPVLKGMRDLGKTYENWINPDKRAGAVFFYDYHQGGYAKRTPELLQFMNEFYRLTAIPTDFVYTGKLMMAFTDLLTKDYFKPGSRVLLIHSGGLQGNSSIPAGSLEF